MRRSLVTAVLIASMPVLAQSPPPRQLAVHVVNAATTPARVVEGVRLSLVRSVGGTPVTAGVTRSDRNGRALFDVPSSFLYAYDVRLELVDPVELVIYEPVDR